MASLLSHTSKKHYLTGKTALNIPLANEGYGDWHFTEAFLGRDKRSPKIFLGGEGENWNTNNIFDDFDIYECSAILRNMGLTIPNDQKVYTAGHYRAVLDMLYGCVKNSQYPSHLDIDQWFDNEEQKQILVTKINEMKNHLNSAEWNIVKAWLNTIN